MKTQWFMHSSCTGKKEDANIETDMNGKWKVARINISNGKPTIRKFWGKNAMERALNWAREVENDK